MDKRPSLSVLGWGSSEAYSTQLPRELLEGQFTVPSQPCTFCWLLSSVSFLHSLLVLPESPPTKPPAPKFVPQVLPLGDLKETKTSLFIFVLLIVLETHLPGVGSQSAFAGRKP